MKELYKGENGKLSSSKVLFFIAFIITAAKVLVGGITTGFISFAEPDYSGLSMWLSAVGAAYVIRNHKQKGDK